MIEPAATKHDPNTGVALQRDVRMHVLRHRGRSRAFLLPGWFPPAGVEAEVFVDSADLPAWSAAREALRTEAEQEDGPDPRRAAQAFPQRQRA